MTWTVPTPDPVTGSSNDAERPMLEGVLAWHRATLLNICAGLTGAQLASRPVASSNLSLLGLIRHLAKVDRIWFRQRAAGDPVPPMYTGAKDADYDDLDPDAAEQDHARLLAEWQLADAAVADLPLDHEYTVNGELFSLRMTYLHLIDEYARHNGHADLLREAIDGVTAR